MRLDKSIASQGEYSRREVKELLKKGRIAVNGVTVKDPGLQVNPETDQIVVDGVSLNYKEHVYLMLNKPKGYISATEDRSQKTVLDLVPEELFRSGLFPAGRLDGDTTGFILLTDDGAFAHKILSPKNHIQKTYVALLEHPVSEEDIAAFEQGIILGDGTDCLPAEVEVLEENVVQIKICEGKYHQIKRMFAARDNRVQELMRTHMGLLELDPELEEGECREITPEELELVQSR